MSTASLTARLAPLLVLGGLAGAAVGQDGVPEGFPDPMAPPARVALPEDGVTLPLLPGMELPTVEVMVGEHGPYRFIVEWAGNVLAVSERVQREAGLETAALMEDDLAVVRVPRMTAGAAEMEGAAAIVMPFFTHTDHDGALGLNVFAEIVGTLDFAGQTLHLSAEALPDPAEDPTVVRYSPGPGGSPRVPVSLGEARFEAVLDTAADSALIVDDRLLDQLELGEALRAGPVVMTPVQGRLETQVARLAGDLVVGSLRVPQPEAMFHRMQEPEVLLGGGVLRGHVLSLDQANRRLRLARAGDAQAGDARAEASER